MRRVIALLLMVLLATALWTTLALAQDEPAFVFPITVNGDTFTLTVRFVGETLVVEPSSPTIKIGEVKKVEQADVILAKANRNANLRSGPGTGYAVAGTVTDGQALQIVDKSADGEWYQLVDGTWIAAFLVDDAPVPTPTLTATAPSTRAIATPTKHVPTATATPPTRTVAASEDGIEFGTPVILGDTGFTSVGLLVTNTTSQVKSFILKVTFKIGTQIGSVATGAVNDLLPGQTRVVLLLPMNPIPDGVTSVNLGIETMIREAPATAGSKAAQAIVFGEPALSGTAGFQMINVEVTNRDQVAHSFIAQAALLSKGELVGYANGAVNDLGPGETKTATLMVQGTADADSISLTVETVVR